MELLTLGTFAGPAGTYRQTAELTKTQRYLLAKLKVAHPKKTTEGTPARLRAGQTANPGTKPGSHLRNPCQR